MKRLISAIVATALVLSGTLSIVFSDSPIGDANTDGKITIADASYLLKFIAGWEVPVDMAVADTKSDGLLTIADVSFLLKYIAGWDVVLGEPIDADVGYDFGDAEFRFLYYGEPEHDFVDEYIWEDRYTGGVIDDAVCERNRKVEHDFNVVITAEECGSPINEAVVRMQAGQCDFDVIYESGILQKSAALDGYLYDFNLLDENYYIDLDESYWLPEANEGLTVADRLFVASNAVSMNYFANAEIIYFNKNMIEELNLAYPYDLVHEGTWTYDALYEMSVAAETDMNRDGALDNRDRFGGISGESLLAGVCAAPLVEREADGTYSLIPYTEGMVGQYSKYFTKFNNLTSLSEEEILAGKDISVLPSPEVAARYFSFGEGHTLFMEGTVDMTKEFVDMRDDYGIVPMPVVNEGDEYVTETDCSACMFSIPVQVEDPEKTGAVFDYLAQLSEMYLLPAYIETTIHTKRIHDTRDYDMLDIIRQSIRYQWIDIYLWDKEIEEIRLRMLGSGDFASVANRYFSKCQSEVDEVVGKIMALY